MAVGALVYFAGGLFHRSTSRGADREADYRFRLVHLTHEAGLDWYHLKVTHEVRCGRKKAEAIDATEVFAQISGKAPTAHVRKASDRDALGLEDEWLDLSVFAGALEKAPDALARFDIERDGHWPDEVNPDGAEPTPTEKDGLVGHRFSIVCTHIVVWIVAV